MTNFFGAILLPFYLQNFLKYEPGHAGLMMMISPLTMIVFGPIGGYLGDKIDKEKLTAFSVSLVVISQIGFYFFNSDTTIFYMIAIISLNAIGAALFQSPNNTMVMSNVDKQYLGIAGSFNALARNLGMVLGISGATITLFTTMSIITNTHVTTYLDNNANAFIQGMHVSFIVASIVSLIALFSVLSRLLSKNK
jgi:MFS family permease